MKISGHVDLCGPELIEGWLYCDAWDGEPIKLQVFVGSELMGECEADRFRNDLQEAGFGDGRCGFSFSVPEGVSKARFAETKLRLVNTPVFLLPDEFTTISGQIIPTTEMVAGLNEASEVDTSRRFNRKDDGTKDTSRKTFASPREGLTRAFAKDSF